MGDAISEGLEIGQMRASINLFAARCASTAEEKGFHQAFEDADWLEQLASASDVDTIITTRLREIAKRIRLLEVGTKLMLVCSELGEAFESVRDTGFDGHIDGDGNFGEELADAMIRLGDLSHMTEVQVGDEITDKMGVNKNRPHLHGRKA